MNTFFVVATLVIFVLGSICHIVDEGRARRKFGRSYREVGVSWRRSAQVTLTIWFYVIFGLSYILLIFFKDEGAVRSILLVTTIESFFCMLLFLGIGLVMVVRNKEFSRLGREALFEATGFFMALAAIFLFIWYFVPSRIEYPDDVRFFLLFAAANAIIAGWFFLLWGICKAKTQKLEGCRNDLGQSIMDCTRVAQEDPPVRRCKHTMFHEHWKPQTYKVKVEPLPNPEPPEDTTYPSSGQLRDDSVRKDEG